MLVCCVEESVPVERSFRRDRMGRSWDIRASGWRLPIAPNASQIKLVHSSETNG